MKKGIFISILIVLFLSAVSFAGTPSLRPYGIRFTDEGAAHSTPPSGYGDLYVNGDALYFIDDAGNVTNIESGGSTAVDDIGDPDANASIDMTDYTLTVDFGDTDADMFHLEFTGAFGDVSGVLFEQKTGNPTDGTLLELKLADTDPDFVSMATSGTEKVKIDSSGNITLSSGGITLTAGNLTVGGTATLGTIYQAAIAAAASGNTNLTIDAAGTGTIAIGSTSTGAVTVSPTANLNGDVNVGNAATDTLTITSIIDSNVTLDDGTTDSPSLILKDATDETATFTKANGGNVTVTPGGAAESFQVLTGNLAVGNGSPGTAAMNGEDAYIEGDLEVDGTVTLDGAVSANGTLALAGTTTATFGAAEYFQIDSATTDSTTTAGALDINFDSLTNGAEGANIKATFVAGGFGSEVVSGLVLDIDDDSDAAGTLIGLDVNSSDAIGSSDVIGIRLGNALEDQISSTVGAGNQFAVVSAASNTGTDGVIDINYSSVTNGAEAINLDVDVGDTGAGVTVTGMLIDLDDDTSSNAATINGFTAQSSDLTGHANTVVRGFYASGVDVALQADNGYVRIGTGSTPDVTPGDDDLYVEGTVEVDGAARFDGAVTMTSTLAGYRSTVTDGAATNPYSVTSAMCGNTFYNSQAIQFNLPEASTVIGCTVTFAVMHASNLDVNPDNLDLIVAATDAAGDMIRSATVGDTVTLQAVSASQWIVKGMYPAATDWTDAN